ncbi:hypothetical protein [Prauserella rugosa]|uniref:Holliday junction resolvasome RuvABC endonuclease subunit n=1 Tax=Prauserella rugosa TaxID=43354 RepID=A0A660C847_9PSEU|nr:hypothetical protein [Prauserella rugosa]TWH18554.1 hypothetical protein JD82_00373 [Prauserella rugosa]
MDVVGYVADAELVVVEGPAYGASGASQHDRAGSWWQVVGRLLSSDVPVVVAAPATVKKFAAGSGRADKAAVAMSMARTWPQWDPLLAVRAEDMADAVACASLGLALLGLQPFPMQKWRQESLAKVQLPDEMEAA